MKKILFRQMNGMDHDEGEFFEIGEGVEKGYMVWFNNQWYCLRAWPWSFMNLYMRIE